MSQLLSQQVNCPYCGESFEALIDTSNEDYIEDCYICCRPIIFTLLEDPGGFSLQLKTEDEC